MAITDPKNHALPASLSPLEASWLTQLSPKTINATIDRGEMKSGVRHGRGRKPARRLGTAEVLYLLLRKEVGTALSSTAKRELYRKLHQIGARTWMDLWTLGAKEPPDFEVELAGGIVKVELKNACKSLLERWTVLCNVDRLVISDPEIRAGEPIIRGTRIPVFLIAQLVEQGADFKEILEDYPALNSEKVKAALAFVQTHPRRGRPRKAPWHE